MTQVAILLVAGVAAAVLFGLFARWERSGREHFVVMLLLAMLVLETSLYENQDLMPRDIFHPGSGAFEFRLPEVIITLALLARMVVRGRATRVGVAPLLWMAFGAWILVAAVEGVLRHNDFTQIPYQAKAVVYVVGGYALAAGVPIRRFLEGRALTRLVRWSAVAATVLMAMQAGHRVYAIHLPLLPLPDFGVDGSDAATIFAAIGLIGLLLELAQEKRSKLTLLACLALLVSPFLANQRAVLVMLGASVTAVLVVATGRTARRRLRVKSAEVLLTAMAVVGVVLGVSVIPALEGSGTVQVPLSSTLAKTFDSTGKIQSAQDRASKWSVAFSLIRQHPILGNGLGVEFSFYEPGPNVITVTDVTENIGLDLWMRAGVIAVVLFVITLLFSLVDGMAAWRQHPDRMVAVLALALVAVVVGLVTKGMVESIFEKYRLATMLGLSLGLLRSAVTSAGGTRWTTRRARAYEEV
ncbi:MAG TPA: O-antigen ligase family protein [Acidimicrobiales bacterium]|nr:O-antigen ligase family protein [Acidimicrobiales bacterium]